jgi:hypothetical protein
LTTSSPSAALLSLYIFGTIYHAIITPALLCKIIISDPRSGSVSSRVIRGRGASAQLGPLLARALGPDKVSDKKKTLQDWR